MEQTKQHGDNSLRPRLIAYPSAEEQYKLLLKSASNTVSMSSGYVVLSPGESVGRHNTEGNEEMLIPLAGTGKLILPDSEDLEFDTGCVLYNPPQTEHDVLNIGTEPLIYIYVVSKA